MNKFTLGILLGLIIASGFWASGVYGFGVWTGGAVVTLIGAAVCIIGETVEGWK